MDMIKFKHELKPPFEKYPLFVSDESVLIDKNLWAKDEIIDKQKNSIIWRDRQLIEDFSVRCSSVMLGHDTLEYIIRSFDSSKEIFYLYKVGSKIALIHYSNEKDKYKIFYKRYVSGIICNRFYALPTSIISHLQLNIQKNKKINISILCDVPAIKRPMKNLMGNRVALSVNDCLSSYQSYIRARCNCCGWLTDVRVANNKIMNISTQSINFLNKKYLKRFQEALFFFEKVLNKCSLVDFLNEGECAKVILEGSKIEIIPEKEDISTLMPCPNVSLKKVIKTLMPCPNVSLEKVELDEIIENYQIIHINEYIIMKNDENVEKKEKNIKWCISPIENDIIEYKNIKNIIKMTILYCKNIYINRIYDFFNFLKNLDNAYIIRNEYPFFIEDILIWLENDVNSSHREEILDLFIDLLSKLTDICITLKLYNIKNIPKKIYKRSSIYIDIYENSYIYILQCIINEKFMKLLYINNDFNNVMNLLIKTIDILPLFLPFLRFFIEKIPKNKNIDFNILKKILHRTMNCMNSNDEESSWSSDAVIPTVESSEEEELPFMKDVFKNVEEYQSTIYRLLRANCFYSLRKAIYNLKNDTFKWNFRDLNSFRISPKEIILPKSGLGPVIKMDVHPYFIRFFDRRIDCQRRQSKRSDLMTSNLVCICLKDLDFSQNSRILAVVQSQPIFKKDYSIEVCIHLFDDPSLPDNGRSAIAQMTELVTKRGAWFWMFESPVFYAAYQAPLKALRTHSLKKVSIIDYIIGHKRLSSLENMQKMPFFSPELDESQKKAVLTAITTPFSIIQGPPGTGKSFVGLEILRLLLSDEAARQFATKFLDDEEPEIRVLWLSYKNHITDEMLKLAIKKNIICGDQVCRLGGRSDDSVHDFTLKSKALSSQRTSEDWRIYKETIDNRNEITEDLNFICRNLLYGLTDARLIINHINNNQIIDIINKCIICNKTKHEKILNKIYNKKNKIYFNDIKDIKLCVDGWLKPGFDELKRLEYKEENKNISNIEYLEDYEDIENEINIRSALIENIDIDWKYNIYNIINKNRYINLYINNKYKYNQYINYNQPLERMVLLKNLEEKYILKNIHKIESKIKEYNNYLEL
eukprot:GHVL01016335.1.p1 GENE.GHVL01016335.1~~GHVL01016335.1.p1  ORF type:complete len:1096 (+),score=309.35 GHVL01016335.1:30-3317(+)